MPYWRLMYDWDNNYTKKEKRMILLTQEAIDKINGLTPGGWAEYTAGSWIAISAQNVISNTKQFDPTNAWTTWQVLKKVGNSYSWANAEWWAMFVTQEEYDALPASKLTDGIEYIIVDDWLEREDVVAMADWWLSYLNETPYAAAQHYYESGDVSSKDLSDEYELGSWKYAVLYWNDDSWRCPYYFCYTNMTEQELIDAWVTSHYANLWSYWERVVDCWPLE